MTFSAILASTISFAKNSAWPFLKDILASIWPFLKDNWKQISWTAFLLWVIMCVLTHCSGAIDPWGYHGDGRDTTSVTRDTVWIHPDTNAIFVLHGFDTIPKHVEKLSEELRRLRSRFRPQAPSFLPDSDCRDSVASLLAHGELLTKTLEECDDAYLDALTIRTYSDTLRNDSIKVSVEFRVEGRLFGQPRIAYSYLAPYPVITETIIIRDPHIQPRQVYVGGGIGPRLTWDGNQMDAIIGSAELGYTTRKNLSVGVAGDFTHKDYGVRAVIRKGFNLGK
jgi:hypothetical protein